jgi:hypothetical protein
MVKYPNVYVTFAIPPLPATRKIPAKMTVEGARETCSPWTFEGYWGVSVPLAPPKYRPKLKSRAKKIDE